MKIGLNNIEQCITSMDDFQLKWRFTEDEYDVLPIEHLDQLNPLNTEGANFVWDYISTIGLHYNIPFKDNLFQVIDRAKITEENSQSIKKWLYQRALPFDKTVWLSWQPDTAMLVPWKLFIKYFDSFYYAISDDLTVFDESLTWAMLCFHENEVYFGSNQNFQPSNAFEDMPFYLEK